MITETKKYDAILVAGEGESSYKVLNQHKGFLKIDGKSIINYVVEALQGAECIKNIYIVGNKEKLLSTLQRSEKRADFSKPIRVVAQKSNLYENIWDTFLKTLPHEGNIADLENSEYKERAVVIVPCDAPLLTSHEVDYFLLKCDAENNDHLIGLVDEKSLEYFYPSPELPGIKMNYLHLKEKSYRINNLHLVKPLMILNRQYIKDMYQFRYQRKFKNIILFALQLIGKDKLDRFRYYIGLQMGLVCASLRLPRLKKYFRTWVPKNELEQCLSNVMNTRFAGLEVPFPGAALDIDNDQDYETIKLRFQEWQSYLRQLNQKYPLPFRDEYIGMKGYA